MICTGSIVPPANLVDLQGNLALTNIKDLMRFLNSSDRTGELYLRNHAQQTSAQAYFDRGNLIHAATEAEDGLEALVEILGWTNGDFRFTPDALNSDSSIDMPLHLALLEANRIVDERLQNKLGGSINTLPSSNKDPNRQTMTLFPVDDESDEISSTVLARYADIPDYQASVIATAQGIPLATHGSMKIAQPALIAKTPIILLESATRTAVAAGLGKVDFALLDCEKGSLIARWTDSHRRFALCLFLENSERVGVAKYRINTSVSHIHTYATNMERKLS